ncbi:unnamed protein product [Penicillium pancosmium]
MASTIFFGELNAGIQVGVNNAPINQIQLPPERPETPSEPLSTVPFLRDVDFVDRGTILEQVEEKCITRKSQLAIEYSYRVRERSPNTWVFWVHASNAARFEQGYRAIAHQAKIPGYRDPKASVVSLVTDWLQVEKRKWTLILDNVDDDQFFRELQKNQAAHQQRPLGFLPCSSNGSIIITTRSRAVALRFVDERNLIEVNPMDSLDASALMNAKLGYQTEQGIATQDDIMKLTEALEFMPLAIVQAAAYIRHPASRCSVAQYLEDFQSSDSQKLKLLDYDVGNIHRDMDSKNSILVTWSLSFEHIRQTRPSAADLLSLMSLFDRQGIPEAVLQKQIPQEQTPRKKEKGKIREWFNLKFRSGRASCAAKRDSPDYSKESGATNVAFDVQRDVMMLRDYCLVSIGQDSSFGMHRLVQLSMQKWLAANGELEKWKFVFVEKLDSEFPGWANDEDWSLCRSLFPHVQSALSQKPLSRLALSRWASLLYKAAHYGYFQDEGTRLEEMAMESMNARTETLGDMDPEGAILLSLIYGRRGQWQRSIDMLERVHRDTKKIYGEEHIFTLRVMKYLAKGYCRKGRFQEAETLQLKELQIKEIQFGDDDLSVAESMQDLAWIYREQRRFQEAFTLELKVIEIFKKQLGPEDPDTLATAKAMVDLYPDSRPLEVAESLGIDAFEICEKTLGPHHPKTLNSAGYLSMIHSMGGRHEEAETLACQVLETHKRIHGSDHLETIRYAENLSEIWVNIGKYQEAEVLTQQLLETKMRVWGTAHLNVLKCRKSLSEILVEMGRYQESEAIKCQLIESFRESVGPLGFETINCLWGLACLYDEMKEFQKASSLRYQIFEAKSLSYGAEHPETLRSLYNLSLSLERQGQDLEAMDRMTECRDKQANILGVDHPDTKESSRQIQLWQPPGLDIGVAPTTNEAT